MFNTEPAHGEGASTYTFKDEQLYHASLAPDEYRSLLDRSGFEVVHHLANDVPKRRQDRLAVPAQASPMTCTFLATDQTPPFDVARNKARAAQVSGLISKFFRNLRHGPENAGKGADQAEVIQS